MAKNENRQYVGLKCSICLKQIRQTIKNNKNNPYKLELNKFCPACKQVTVFKEVKLNRS